MILTCNMNTAGNKKASSVGRRFLLCRMAAVWRSLAHASPLAERHIDPSEQVLKWLPSAQALKLEHYLRVETGWVY